MKILLLGKNGQLGKELDRNLTQIGNLTSVCRFNIDITDFDKIKDYIQKIKPDVIVNAAAYTNVDNAETEKAIAYKVNSHAVLNLAKICKENDIWLIHYSTDYVFDGKKTSPYTELHETSPINTYGKSKLQGEEAITQIGCKNLIFRTTWVIGKDGKNFAKTILNLAISRNSLNVIDDQIGVPTTPSLISKVTSAAIKSILQNKPWPSGIYNLTPKGSTTWYGIAKLTLSIAEEHGINLKVTSSKIKPIDGNQFKTVAERPSNSLLVTEKLDKQLDFKLPTWELEFKKVLDDILKERSDA
jgi:dTDP-4-dehydrorhamnose reductase